MSTIDDLKLQLQNKIVAFTPYLHGYMDATDKTEFSEQLYFNDTDFTSVDFKSEYGVETLSSGYQLNVIYFSMILSNENIESWPTSGLSKGLRPIMDAIDWMHDTQTYFDKGYVHEYNADYPSHIKLQVVYDGNIDEEHFGVYHIDGVFSF